MLHVTEFVDSELSSRDTEGEDASEVSICVRLCVVCVSDSVCERISMRACVCVCD